MFELALGSSLELSHTQELRLEQSLTVEQRLEIKLDQQIALILALRGDHYRPEAVCPECGHRMTAVEILRGFNQDPNDLTTKCPNCKMRFTSRLIARGHGTSIELVFYCPIQVLQRLSELKHLDTQAIHDEEPAAYNSAIFHYGSLKAAYLKLSIEWPFPELISDWTIKVQGFLSQVPDPMIASTAGVSVYKVRALRRSLNIEPFHGYER